MKSILLLSVSRYLFFQIPPKQKDFWFTNLALFSTSSPSVEKFWSNLLEKRTNLEKSLESVNANLDSPCIGEVLKRCVVNNPQLGLRFFIWSGTHRTYRHSSYTYSKACELLGLEKNPSIVADVLSAYRAEKIVVNIKMFKIILNLCRAAKDEKLGLWVLRKMKEFNCGPDTVAYNVVIRLLVENGELEEATKLMGEMGLIDLYPDMITYVSMIKGFCDAGRLEGACQLIKSMKGHGCAPNAVVYSTLLDGVCKHGDLDKALEFLEKMEQEDDESRPNVITYSAVIKGFVEKGRAMEALGVLDRMEDSGLQPNSVTITALIDGLCKEGRVDEAHKLIDRVGSGSEHCGKFYGLLVTSLCRIGQIEEAEKIFRMMIASGRRPNDLVSTIIVKAILSEGRVLDGLGLFYSLEKSGYLPATDSDIYSIILAGLCKKSYLVEAARLVNLIVERGVRLKPRYVQNIVKYLKEYGEDDLASRIGSIDS